MIISLECNLVKKKEEKLNLLRAWYNIEAANGVFEKVDGVCICALDNINATGKSLCISVTSERTNIRSTT